MNFSFYIAKRYLFSSGSNNAINIITGIAAAGVVIGAMSLFLVLTGFAGLKDFSLRFSSYFDPDLKVFAAQGKRFTFSESQKQKLSEISGIAAYSEIIEERVFLDFKEKQTTAFIKGVDQKYANVITVDSILVVGDWLTGSDAHVVVGAGIGVELNMGVESVYSDFLDIYVPRPGKGIISDPSKAFRKMGTVNIGIYSVNEDVNKKYVFGSIGLARQLLQLPQDTVTHLELSLTDGANTEVIKEQLLEIFDHQVVVKNRVQLNDALYKMLNTENLVAYLVITLIAIIALFNVAGAIIMMIIDKKDNIKTLHNMGATLRSIRSVFLYQGLLMTVLGTLLGLFLGFVLIVMQQQFGLLMITVSLPYPTKITVASFIIVFITITTIGCVAAWLASSRINSKLIIN